MLTLGSALVTSAILLTILIAFLFRRPDPPRWTRPDLVAMLAGVPPTAVLGLGFGYMLIGLHRLISAPDVYDLAGAVAIWALAAAVWHRLGVRARFRAYAAAGRPGVVAASHLAGPGGSSAAPPASPAGSSHLRAA